MKREKKVGDKVRIAGGFAVVITKIYNQSPKMAEVAYPSGKTMIVRVSELKYA